MVFTTFYHFLRNFKFSVTIHLIELLSLNLMKPAEYRGTELNCLYFGYVITLAFPAISISLIFFSPVRSFLLFEHLFVLIR